MRQNAVNWFEIFATNFQRARDFYETIMATRFKEAQMEGAEMAFFPYNEEDGVGGAVTKMDCGQPGPGGTLVYLNVEGQLDEVIARIAPAGGKVIKERTAIPPHGFIAILEDTEGNVVGLHSMS